MQEQSIYNETYKPLFINYMENEKLKGFSQTLSDKLRHVKLAISKANLSQNKYLNMGDTNNPDNKINLLGSSQEGKNKLKPIVKL
jgi:hypothetical protein